MKKTKLILLALGVSLLLLLAACGGGGTSPGGSPPQGGTGTQGTNTTPGTGTTPGSSTPEVPAGGPSYGGLLRVIVGGDISQPFGLPWEMALRTMDLLTPYGETLLLETMTGELLPWLAESYEVDLDNMEIRFKLKENVYFTDGSQFNAEVLAWQSILAVETRAMNQAVVGCEVRGEFEVAMILGNYVNTVMTHFSSHVTTNVSKENFDKNGATYAMENPIGTGPFVLKERIPGAMVSFSRNDSYWVEGKPYLDEVEYIGMTDVMTQNAAMETTGVEGVDVLRTGIGEQGALLSSFSHLKSKSYPSGNMVLAPDSNNPDSPLSLFLVRQAISLAIDREGITEARGFGMWRPSYQIFPEGFKGYLPELHPDAFPDPFDPAKAKELLAEAGYPNGFSTVLNVPSSVDREAAVAIQNMLSNIGIQCEMVFPEAGAATEMRLGGWEGLLAQTMAAMTMTSSIIRLQLDPYNEYLPSAWRPIEEMEPVYDASRATPIPEDDLMKQLQRFFVDNLVVIPIYAVNSKAFERVNVHDTGFGVLNNSTTIWAPWDAWKE